MTMMKELVLINDEQPLIFSSSKTLHNNFTVAQGVWENQQISQPFLRRGTTWTILIYSVDGESPSKMRFTLSEGGYLFYLNTLIKTWLRNTYFLKCDYHIAN